MLIVPSSRSLSHNFLDFTLYSTVIGEKTVSKQTRMSAALVAAFYDAGEVLSQNRQNFLMHSSGSGSHMRTDQRGMHPDSSDGRSCNEDVMLRELGIGQLNQDRCSPPAIGSGPGGMDRSEPASRYKTELCRPYEESGHCKYGDKCQFAHGMRELRTLSRHPKYKTELCRTFHTIGFCPYGPRCHFIHNEDERRLSQIFQMRQAAASPQPRCRAAPPTVSHVHRPKALCFRGTADYGDAMGSTADSPPSSVTDSPTRSPTFPGEVDQYADRMFTPIPHQSAPLQQPTAFPFHNSRWMAPLNVQTGDALANLAASLQATSLADESTLNAEIIRECLYRMRLGSGTTSLPSPPESLSDADSGVSTCGSPLEVSRGLYLGGIFGTSARHLDV